MLWFPSQYNVVKKRTCTPLAVDSVDRISDHSFEGQNDRIGLHFFVMPSIMLYEVVLTINFMREILCLLPFDNVLWTSSALLFLVASISNHFRKKGIMLVTNWLLVCLLSLLVSFYYKINLICFRISAWKILSCFQNFCFTKCLNWLTGTSQVCIYMLLGLTELVQN